MKNNEMLNKLLALNFSMIDLNLYLDTHPLDADTIKKFNELKREYEELKCEYENIYGTLTPGTISKTEWTWICDPWPWEKMFN